MPNSPFYAFYGHHKCATMWWNRIIANACNMTGLNFRAVYDKRGFDGDLKQFIDDQQIDFISHGNADIRHIADLGDHRGVHIIRDPRDIAVSAYFSHLHSHSVKEWSELEDYREKLRGMSKDDGLAAEIENRKTEFGQLESWDYEQPNVLEVKFEDMAHSSYDLVLRAFQHYGIVDDAEYRLRQRLRGLFFYVFDGITGRRGRTITRRLRPDKLPGAELLEVAWQYRFQSLAGGRKQGDEDVTSHFRKGRPGDWINHFTDEHKALFKELYPEILIRLGYESSNDW
jgi:hypothetical protein